MLKDLGLAADAAKASGRGDGPLGAGAREFYQMVVAHGEGHKDFGVAYRFLTAATTASARDLLAQ
jgi:3-hydroxyisobutyrate dehydrogenase and related beta-hydroxyacid dehydrogenases